MTTIRFFTRSVVRSVRNRRLGNSWVIYYEIY
jgi:hypothetical protein